VTLSLLFLLYPHLDLTPLVLVKARAREAAACDPGSLDSALDSSSSSLRGVSTRGYMQEEKRSYRS